MTLASKAFGVRRLDAAFEIPMEATQSLNQIDWPHAPVHRLDSSGVYMITASTLQKQPFFSSSQKLDVLQRELLALAKKYEWNLHAVTASKINQLDESRGRRVWYNFWDSKLTYERSYFARLSYVHRNPVKHGLVAMANQYRWCSAAWFE